MSDDFRICGFAQHEMELLHAGDGDRARGRLVLAERKLEQLGDAAPEQLADALYQVGSAYEGVGQHARAMEFFGRVLQIWNDKPELVTGNAMSGMAYFCAAAEDSHAEELFRAALLAYEGGDPGIASSCHQSLGELLQKQGRFAEAEEEYRRGLKLIVGRGRPKGWVGAAQLFHRIGISCAAQYKSVEAEAAFEEAFERERTAMSDDYWEVADILADWSRLVRQSDLPRARDMEQRALVIWRAFVTTLRGKSGFEEVVARVGAQISEIERR